MAIAEAPRAELNPALIDPYDQITWQPDWTCDISGSLESPAPIGEIGRITDQAAFSRPIDLTQFRARRQVRRSNDLTTVLPINGDGQPDYQLPVGLEQFQEAVDLTAAHEHYYYPNRRYKEVRLVIDQSPVQAGYSQRTSRPGRPDERYYHRDPFHRAYSTADLEPTLHVVTNQLIRSSDMPCSNQEELPDGVDIYQSDPYEISQSNLLSLHTSPIFLVDAVRTFFLLRYTRAD